MNTKSFLLSGIAGTIVCFLLGWLFYGTLFTDVYPQNDEECMLFIFLGCLFYAFTFALVFNRWAQEAPKVDSANSYIEYEGSALGLWLGWNFYVVWITSILVCSKYFWRHW